MDQTAKKKKSMVCEEVLVIFNKFYTHTYEKNNVKVLVKFIKDGGCLVIVE